MEKKIRRTSAQVKKPRLTIVVEYDALDNAIEGTKAVLERAVELGEVISADLTLTAGVYDAKGML